MLNTCKLVATGDSEARCHSNIEDNYIIGTAAETPPLIPEGEYTAAFLRCDRAKFYGRERLFLWFRIVTPGEWQGKELYMVCPVPQNKSFGIGSKFYAAWTIAAGRIPKRRYPLSIAVFRKKYFRVLVTTVTTNQNGEKRPIEERYSKIDRLIGVEAGGNA